MKTLARLALLGAPLLFAAPVVAAAKDAPPASAAKPASAAESDDAGKLVCRREATSGSRLGAKRVCRTAAEWERTRREDQQMTEKVQSQRWKAE